ncbi:bacterio-opsin activator domain-containing protein [Halobacterium yunchengense]|uniref:bacterio-opsin activator domain-containing protein n=1 Tax=Halobacterium yunchengense TaxID=3108497 RepID=UPI00300A4825
MDEQLRGAPVGVLEVTTDGVVEAVNDTARAVLGDDGVQTGVPVSEAFPRSVEDSLPGAFEEASVAAASFEEYYPELDKWLSVSVVPGRDTAAVYVDDVTERQRREQAMQQLRAERDRTAVVEEVLADVLAGLVAAQSRAAIAETICSTLGETDLFAFAWVGERAVDGEDLVSRAAAGDTGETFDAVREAVDSDAPTPEERALETGELQVVEQIADDPGVPECVRRAGFADGVQSLLAIPLVHGSSVHGVVGVYVGGVDSVSDRERASFETLGEVAGFAVTAARNRSLLLSDTVTEVAFEVGDDAALAAVSDAVDATLTLDGLVAEDRESLLCYVSVDGAAASAVAAAARETAGVADCRVIGRGNASESVELACRAGTPLLTVSSLGGTVRRATYDDGAGRIVVELPPDGDVRRMAAEITRDFDAEVAAKRERERSASTSREFRDELGSRLTDRQETVLRTAYLADYFESPRGSTAEEVAASLDITGSTLLHHLRAGQRKLLDVYFAADSR